MHPKRAQGGWDRMPILGPREKDPETGLFFEASSKPQPINPHLRQVRSSLEQIAEARDVNNATKEIWA